MANKLVTWYMHNIVGYDTPVRLKWKPTIDFKPDEFDVWLSETLSSYGLKHIYEGRVQYGRVAYEKHFIYNEKRSFFKKKRINIAQIVSEPGFTEPPYMTHLNFNGLFDVLEIKMLDDDYNEQIHDLIAKYHIRFSQEAIFVPRGSKGD